MSYSICLSICLCLRLCLLLTVYLSIYLPACQTIYQAVWRTATCCSITSILPAGVSKPFPPQIYSILRDLPISRGEGCQSRVQIRPVCPRQLSCMLSRTAARARSAQGASQFAAGHAAVRLTHHGDDRPVHIMKTSQVTARLCFHRLLTFENAKVEAEQLIVKT